MSAAEWLSNPAKGIAKTVRPSQVRMATVVEQVLNDKGFAMIEAGTGTGKSFGYLVPAILSGKRVIISTAKKTLQRQLRDQDVPFLLNALGSTTAFASIKGKNNYVCKLRLEELLSSGAVYSFNQHDISDFHDWAMRDMFGDIDDYKHHVDFAPLVRVSECVGAKCDHFDACGFRRAKTQASTAKIVVVNHALLAYDLYMGGGKILGQYDAVVVDEAHQVSKYFREAFTCRIQNKQPDALKKLLDSTGLIVPETLEQSVHTFLARLPDRGRVFQNNIVVENAMAIIRDLSRLKQQFINEGVWSDNKSDDSDDEENTRDPKVLSRLRAAVSVTQRMLQACEVCIDKLDLKLNEHGEELPGPQDYVTYSETRQSHGHVHKEFVATPIEIGPFVGPALKRTGTVIFTSATLSTGGTFDYICRDVGLRPGDVHQELLPQPFDYRRNSCLFISDKTIEYKRDVREQYWSSCAEVMHELFTASKGGAFVLCSSYEDMNAFFERLNSIPSRGYALQVQSGNSDILVNWFKSTPNAVALGVKSIWEGVDVPGLGLRLVVIPRMPFPNPDDPVFTARKDRFVAAKVKNGAEQRIAEINAWQHYDLQEAIMDFKQGAGRLIRRETDMGVVAVLDRRIYANTKKYANTVRSSIPHPTTYDIESTKTLLRVLASKA